MEQEIITFLKKYYYKYVKIQNDDNSLIKIYDLLINNVMYSSPTKFIEYFYLVWYHIFIKKKGCEIFFSDLYTSWIYGSRINLIELKAKIKLISYYIDTEN